MVEKKIKYGIITLKNKIIYFAVLPQNVAHIFDKLYEDSVAQYELKDFDVRREQLNQ